MTTFNKSTREDYLLAAVDEMKPLFSRIDKEIPKLRVSVGFPSRSALSRSSRRIGECWSSEASSDGIHQIFISPLLGEVATPDGVLATLVHEVGHSVAGVDAKHGRKFRSVAEGVGLEGKMTSTVAGEELTEYLQSIHEKLGPYPHSQLNPALSGIKKQGTRLIKCECQINDCGYNVRVTKKWIDVGVPHCPIHGAMHAELPEE